MSNNLDMDAMQAAIQDIMPGLTMYVRDANLDPKMVAKYQAGMFIMERGYTDASIRVMGMVTTHRYAILSNHMIDLRFFEHDTNWGLFTAQRNAHFKVLDVYEHQGKTQILLLHLPDDDRWSMFQHVTLNLEADFVVDCRKRFENKFLGDVIPELATEDWLDRCSAPVGMSDDGEFFDINSAE